MYTFIFIYIYIFFLHDKKVNFHQMAKFLKLIVPFGLYVVAILYIIWISDCINILFMRKNVCALTYQSESELCIWVVY